MSDARLRSAEESLLGVGRVDDVEGWEIPGRYLSFLRGGDARQLIPVVEHNERDVHSLARLLVHLVDALGDHDRRRHAPDGDLLGLARAFRREGRLAEAMDCLDLAVGRPPLPPNPRLAGPPGAPAAWLVDRSDGIASAIAQRSQARAARLIGDQLARERGRLLRNLGRPAEAREAWRALATRNGPLSAIAWVELAKVLEHVERDFTGALDAVTAAQRLADHSAFIGRPLPMLASDLAHRRARVTRRLAASDPGCPSESRAVAGGEAAPSHAIPDGSPRRHATEPHALHHQ